MFPVRDTMGNIHATPGKKLPRCAAAIIAAVFLLAGQHAWSQDASDDMDEFVVDAAPAGADVDIERSSAPPPRTIDDIARALEKYKPDAKRAEADRAAVRASPPDAADKAALYQFYLNRARAASRIGALGQFIADLRLAAATAPTRDHRKEATRLLAGAEAAGGNYLTAIKYTEDEMADRQQGGRGRGTGPINENCRLATWHAELGDIAEARHNLKICEAAAQRRMRRDNSGLSDHVVAAQMERARMTVYAAEGKLAEGEAAARKALAEMEAFLPGVRNRAAQGVIGNSTNLQRQRNVRDSDERRLAEILMQRGRLVEAEIAARNVLRSLLARIGLYTLPTGQALTTLSRVVFEQGRFKDAVMLATAAVDSLEHSGAVPESFPLVVARRTRGAALAAGQQWSEAIGEFEATQGGIGRDPLLAQKYGAGDVNWAWALIKTGRAEQAVRMLQPMLERLRQRLGERSYQTAELRGFYAMSLAAGGDHARALTEFSAAVPVMLDLLHADDNSEGGGIARTLRRVQILEAYLALLSEMAANNGRSAGIDPLAESFRIADVARGSAVQRALGASAARAQIDDPQLAAIAREEQDAQQRVSTLTDILNRLLSAPPDQQLPKVIGDMRTEITTLQTMRLKLKKDLQQRFPAYASLIDPQPATVAQVQSVLRPEEALLSIYVAGDVSYVWAVPARGAPAMTVAKLGDKEITATVAQLRRALDPGNVDFDNLPRFDVMTAHKLFAELLQPVAAGWRGAKQLAIVPHRALGQLPFSLLLSAPAQPSQTAPSSLPFGEYRDLPWLIRTVAITQLPSVSTLVSLRGAVPGKTQRASFIGFGDPVFSQQQVPATTAMATATRGAVLRSAPFRGGAVDSAELAQLARLPDTADEIREIARALKADMQSGVVLGIAANEHNVKAANLAGYRVIALATHGLVPGDLNGLDQPSLALSAPEVANVEGDGLLTMEEVLALKLDADWVVLSACNTATGDGAGSEAVSGLGRAFFFAGARALLVSNWPVETTSARAITTGLFQRQADQPQIARAEALRETMLALIDGPGYLDPRTKQAMFSYAHPLFWAPFSLVGDGARR
jgi:CHAT domain-containing protein